MPPPALAMSPYDSPRSRRRKSRVRSPPKTMWRVAVDQPRSEPGATATDDFARRLPPARRQVGLSPHPRDAPAGARDRPVLDNAERRAGHGREVDVGPDTVPAGLGHGVVRAAARLERNWKTVAGLMHRSVPLRKSVREERPCHRGPTHAARSASSGSWSGTAGGATPWSRWTGAAASRRWSQVAAAGARRWRGGRFPGFPMSTAIRSSAPWRGSRRGAGRIRSGAGAR